MIRQFESDVKNMNRTSKVVTPEINKKTCLGHVQLDTWDDHLQCTSDTKHIQDSSETKVGKGTG